MIYSRSTSGRRDGDCVIHVPPSYGGSLFVATPEPITGTDYKDITEPEEEKQDERSEMDQEEEIPEVKPEPLPAPVEHKSLLLSKPITTEDLLLIGLIILLISDSTGKNLDLIVILAVLLILF